MIAILSNGDIAAYHRVRDDIEDCLVAGPATATEAKNMTRRLMKMFADKGYSVTVKEPGEGR